MRNGIVVAVLACGLAGAAPAARVGKPAPSFSLTTFAGEKVSRDTLRGKVVLINHWATWCGPCKAEMPAMDAYYRRNRDRGLAIFAVSGPDSASAKALAPLSAVLAIPLSNRFSGSSYGRIDGAVPTSYVIDRAGIVRYASSGAFTAESLETVVGPLLAEPAPAAIP